MMSLKLKKNINTASYWDTVFADEIRKNKWRKNVLTFGKIRTYLALRIWPEDLILDLGCGYGVLLNRLKPLGCSLTGWDISGVAVNEVKKYGNNGRVVDFQEYKPDPDERFDHVIATEFLEHFEAAEEIFNKIYRIARKTVIIAVPNNCMKDCNEHMNVFNIKAMEKMVEKYPFRKLSIENYLDEFIHKNEYGNEVLSSRPTLLTILEKI